MAKSTNTAGLSNSEAARKAARARKQAAANAKRTGGKISEPFSIEAANKDKAKRAYALHQVEQSLAAIVDLGMAKLKATGSVKINIEDCNYELRQWQQVCMRIIDLIRGDKRYAYNADWRKERSFVVGVVRS